MSRKSSKPPKGRLLPFRVPAPTDVSARPGDLLTETTGVTVTITRRPTRGPRPPQEQD